MTVCGKWMQVINEHFRSDNCIVLPENVDYSTDGPLLKTFRKRIYMTKNKRRFSHLLIKSFPQNFSELSNFIRLIRTEINFLTVTPMPFFAAYSYTPANLLNEMVYLKMPNLKSLELSEEVLLGDLRFPEGLQSIKMRFQIQNLENLIKIRSIESVKTLTSLAIKFDNATYEPFVPFVDDNFKAQLKEILGNDQSTSVIIASGYNYCAESKMTTNDVTSMRFEAGFNSLSPAVLSHFENLKVIPFPFKCFLNFICFLCFSA